MPSRHDHHFMLDWKGCGEQAPSPFSTVAMSMYGLVSRRRHIRWLALLLAGLFWFGLLSSAAYSVSAQGGNGIAEPAEGSVISGVVVINGTAQHASFLRYEIAFRQVGSEFGWISFAQGDQPVVAGTLAIWDTSVGQNVNAPVFPDGAYELRLRVVRQDFNYDEYFVTGLTISNSEPTPTPTADATQSVGEQPAPTLPAATTVPDILPTLTPFPTPSPQATPVAAVDAGGPAGPDSEASQGVFAQLAAIETGRFRDAFWRGVQIALFIFVALALYILLRGAGRRLWRLLMTHLTR